MLKWANVHTPRPHVYTFPLQEEKPHIQNTADDKMSYKHQSADVCNPRLSQLPSDGVLRNDVRTDETLSDISWWRYSFGLEKKMTAVRAGSYSHRLEGSVCPHTYPTFLLRPSCLPEKMGINKKRRKSEVIYP